MNADGARDGAAMAFLGDSITASGDWESWFPNERILNYARGGMTTDDLFAIFGDVVDAHPDEIILMIGTNDLGHRRTVEHLVRNIQLMMVEMRRELPGARMLLQSILPRGREFAASIRDANIHLRQFAATVNARFLDLWPAFALPDGELNPEYSPDRLHLNAAGYEAWLMELRPALQRLRELPPMSSPIRVAG